MAATYELYHYGIKGMKWGIRRFQDKNGRLTSAGKKRIKEKDKSESKKSGLTDKQKKAIKIGAAVAATALVAYGAYKLGAFDRFTQSGKTAVDNTLGSDQVKKKVKTVSQVVGSVNPSGSRTNCRACAIATSLGLKGLDVEALNIKGGSLSDAVNSSFKNAKVVEMHSPNKSRVTNYILRKFEEGSQGVIAGELKTPDGGVFQHAFNWAVKNGEVRFMDGQSGSTDVSKYLDMLTSNKSVEMARLDNLDVNWEGISNFIKRR